jgi:hypothetical protein
MSKTKILIIAALAVVSGGCSNPYKYMSVSEVEEEYGRMMRGYVKFVAPDDVYQESLDAFRDEDFARFAAAKHSPGPTKEDWRDYQIVFVRYYRGLDGAKQDTLWIPPEWGRLEQGDIVDFYNGKPAMTDGVAEKSIRIPAVATVTAGLTWFIIDDVKGYPMKELAVILGVVCRATEPGCERNTSLATTIGYGRKLPNGPADYLGVAAEAEQPIARVSKRFAEMWALPICTTCSEDNPGVVIEGEE